MIWARVILWFTTSKTGQTILAVLGAVGAITIAALKVFSAGRAAERSKQDKQSLENLRDRTRIDDEVKTLGRNELGDRLNRWSVPDDK
jgi:hypothetical protein